MENHPDIIFKPLQEAVCTRGKHFYKFILCLSSIFFSATALRLHLKSSVEEMLKYSKQVMTSKGEWELIGLTANNFLQPATHGELYEELRFAVRKYSRLIFSICMLCYVPLRLCCLVGVCVVFLLSLSSVNRSLS